MSTHVTITLRKSRTHQRAVIQYGGLPLPVGGVTSHVASLVEELATTSVRPVVVDRTSGVKLPSSATVLSGRRGLARALVMRSAVHHLHVSRPLGRQLAQLVILCLILPGKRTCITFHSGGFPTAYSSRRARWALWVIGERVSIWFTLNTEATEFVDRLEVRACAVPTSSYVSAVASPGEASQRVHGELNDLRTRVHHLIATSGYGVANSGFIDLVETLTGLGESFGLVIVAYGEIDRDYMDRVRAAIGGTPCLLLGPLEPVEFRYLLTAVDVYVRNTTADAYGLAVAEALDLGTPAAATSVCERAEGCATYELGDRDALAELIESLSEGDGPEPSLVPNTSSATYLNAYACLLGTPVLGGHD